MARAGVHAGGESIGPGETLTILIAPDSFKGSLRAEEAATAMASGVNDACPGARTLLHPVADGGEGLVDLLVPALDGVMAVTRVHGPLPGQHVDARWGYVGSRRLAIIEMAQAAGLNLVPGAERDPRLTTTLGVGELMLAALDRGAHEILMGIGGSATNDGGAGMATALGVRFLDREGRPLAPGGAALRNLVRIDRSSCDPRLSALAVTVACDVQNPLTGPEGASIVYGPQKGATTAIALELDQSLRQYAARIRDGLGIDVELMPGSGAAGGLGAGLAAFCSARLRSGIDIVLDATGFDEKLGQADLVLTGEGMIDAQTTFGKALAGVVKRAQKAHRPVVAIAGNIQGDRSTLLRSDAFRFVASLVDDVTTVEVAMTRAGELLRAKTAEVMRTVVLRDDGTQTR